MATGLKGNDGATVATADTSVTATSCASDCFVSPCDTGGDTWTGGTAVCS